MPRKIDTVALNQRKAIVAHLDHYCADRRRAGDKVDDIADRLGMCRATLLHRRTNPEAFTLQELQILAGAMNISLLTLLGGKA